MSVSIVEKRQLCNIRIRLGCRAANAGPRSCSSDNVMLSSISVSADSTCCTSEKDGAMPLCPVALSKNSVTMESTRSIASVSELSCCSTSAEATSSFTLDASPSRLRCAACWATSADLVAAIAERPSGFRPMPLWKLSWTMSMALSRTWVARDPMSAARSCSPLPLAFSCPSSLPSASPVICSHRENIEPSAAAMWKDWQPRAVAQRAMSCNSDLTCPWRPMYIQARRPFPGSVL
mmetsp:Transcript_39386/g.111617  ORF Transcript_39386/g.111617 Transcript_39386/m.111617 type:complete len:235 (-) Transcript_39386:2917-3621(-)